jgi:hypothetical protein
MVPTLVVESAGITRCRCIILEERLARRVFLRDLAESDLPILFEHQKVSYDEPFGFEVSGAWLYCFQTRFCPPAANRRGLAQW